jgi:hypothetical protein
MSRSWVLGGSQDGRWLDSIPRNEKLGEDCILFYELGILNRLTHNQSSFPPSNPVPSCGPNTLFTLMMPVTMPAPLILAPM